VVKIEMSTVSAMVLEKRFAEAYTAMYTPESVFQFCLTVLLLETGKQFEEM
jgi:hypothetical protein